MLFSAKNSQKGGFARAIGSNEAYAVIIMNGERESVEERRSAESF